MKAVVTIIFYAFGMFELITNTIYLLTKNGICRAYGQHREIPPQVSCHRMKIKIITMLMVGIVMTASLLFLLAGNAVFASYIQKAAIIGYVMYAIGEAIAYPAHKLGWALAALMLILTILYFL